MRFLSPLLLFVLAPLVRSAELPPAVQEGDKLLLIGSTLIEREQRYGYWETVLTKAFPTLTIRNLGWSGDTVLGTARAGFDLSPPTAGRKKLLDLVTAEKPTAIVVCYGGNEAFEGEKGLANFVKEYNALLDELSKTKARITLLTPLLHEKKGVPLPDPTSTNQNILMYCEQIKQIANKRGLRYADLNSLIGEPKGLTDNGVHLTEQGYRQTAGAFMQALGFGKNHEYSETLEPVREAIREKNELYFHRWRPQNETYLFGFRKHEQGRNAKEVAEFDPLVSQAEEKIRKLLKK